MSDKTQKNSRGETFQVGDRIKLLDGKKSLQDKGGCPTWIAQDMDPIVGEVFEIVEIKHYGPDAGTRFWILQNGLRSRWCYHPEWATISTEPFDLDKFAEYLKTPVEK